MRLYNQILQKFRLVIQEDVVYRIVLRIHQNQMDSWVDLNKELNCVNEK